MKQIQIDTALFAQLDQEREPVELIGPDGQSLGKYYPGYREGDPIVPWHPEWTREDLDRMAKGPRITTAELKRQLGMK